MKTELPASDHDMDRLLRLPCGALKWELLKTVIELNLFDCLYMQIMGMLPCFKNSCRLLYVQFPTSYQ